MNDFKNIEGFLARYLNKFSIIKITDNKLQFTDGYYIDKDLSRYLFYFKIFDKEEVMLESWKTIQNEDIALYMQRNLFPCKDIRWDIYFVLINCDNYQSEEDNLSFIERDKFCCKKIVVDGRTIENLEKGLKAKLPFTSDYYPMDNVALINEAKFLDELRKIASLDKEIFTNQVLNNIDDEFGELLRGIEVQL